MSIEFLQNLSVIFFIASGVLFLISVILFFVFRIPRLVAEITGVAEKRDIQQIREQSERTYAEYTPELNLNFPEISGSLETGPVSAGTTKLQALSFIDNSDTPDAPADDSEITLKDNENILPAITPDTIFSVIEEFSFTSSEEIIE